MLQQNVRKRKTPVLMIISVQSVKSHGTKLDVVIKKLSYLKV